ncbi:hypothetical protein J2Z19_003224 [Ensifer adhaerens]|uniref:Uncharacterized protein n=1 Tax=Ensifer adhaerens TaxID=106592 RepID=A0ACC5SYP7_ENSAD|nr:hypothetical protein [Ensifer adhaerens]MBP1873509.1 hypothetical protein [Ensifer adhaerens]
MTQTATKLVEQPSSAGNWRAYESAGFKGEWGVETDEPAMVKDGDEIIVYPSLPKHLADLIAAAPDLFAALKSLGPIIEEIHAKWDEGMRAGKLIVALGDPNLKYRADITAIHAAIAKAEGR